MKTRALTVAALIVLAGCGGGGGSSPAPSQPAVQSPTAPGPPPAGSATLTLNVPRTGSSARRAPLYVSPNSAALVVTVKTVDGQPPTAAQVPVDRQTTVLSTGTGGNCTVSPSGETCTVTIAAPTGQVTYQFDLLDGSTNANTLATLTQTFTIAAGSSPHLQAVLDGIVSSVTVTHADNSSRARRSRGRSRCKPSTPAVR